MSDFIASIQQSPWSYARQDGFDACPRGMCSVSAIEYGPVRRAAVLDLARLALAIGIEVQLSDYCDKGGI
jgi:hypothetical protein